MNILKEISCEPDYIGACTLENGVIVFARADGIGFGTDGKRYCRVSKEFETEPMPADPIWMFEDYDADPIPDSVLVDIGWTTEADGPVVW